MRAGHRIPIKSQRFILGHGGHVDLVLSALEREHCALEASAGGLWQLVPLSGVTSHNGAPADGRALRHGDLLTLAGRIVLRFLETRESPNLPSRSSAHPSLEVLTRQELLSASVVRIDSELFEIGRAHEADCQVRSGILSKQHCRIGSSDGVWRLEDLGTSNGTVHNGVRVARGVKPQLSHGDLIDLPNGMCLRFLTGEQVEPPEALIAAALDTPEGLAIYDDWLLERGSPTAIRLGALSGAVARGEVVATCERGFPCALLFRVLRSTPVYNITPPSLLRVLVHREFAFVRVLDFEFATTGAAAGGGQTENEPRQLLEAIPPMRALETVSMKGADLSGCERAFEALRQRQPRLRTTFEELGWKQH